MIGRTTDCYNKHTAYTLCLVNQTTDHTTDQTTKQPVYMQLNIWGSSMFLGSQPHPYPKGRGPSVVQIFWTSCRRAQKQNHQKQNQILCGDQTRCEESVYMVKHDW